MTDNKLTPDESSQLHSREFKLGCFPATTVDNIRLKELLAAERELDSCNAAELREYIGKLEAKLKPLEHIAALCFKEMNYGLHVPSEVFEAVEKYYEEKR